MVVELRNYDPRLGKWLSPDPYQQHWSPYLAMSNNPVSFIDPDGGRDYEWYNGAAARSAAAKGSNMTNDDRASEKWEEMNRITLLVDGQEVGYHAFRGYATSDNIEYLIDGSVFGYGGAYNSANGIRGIVELIDDRRPGYYYSKSYNYGTSIMGLLERNIDGNYADPIFDYAGNFLGDYGDSDFNGEIMLMDKATYNNIRADMDLTEKDEENIVLSYDLAESNGVCLKNFLDRKTPKGDFVKVSDNDLTLISNVFTNLLIEADKEGLIKFDKKNLFEEGIGLMANKIIGYKNSSDYYGLDNAKTAQRGSVFGVQVDIAYYVRDSKGNYKPVGPYIRTLHHAGNAISCLGVHEYKLHGMKGLPPSEHPSIYKKQIKHAEVNLLVSPKYLRDLYISAGYDPIYADSRLRLYESKLR